MRYYIVDPHFFHEVLNTKMHCRGFRSAEDFMQLIGLCVIQTEEGAMCGRFYAAERIVRDPDRRRSNVRKILCG